MTRTEKRRISETMDSIMIPLIQYLDEQTKEVVRQALRILRDDEIKEIKTGHWKKIEPYPMMEHEYRCSECYHETDNPFENYCSECGAKMEVEE